MNQAIQFPDREEWSDVENALHFPVMVNGMLLTCVIHGDTLASRFGGDTPAQWLALFSQHRWDLEDEAEQLILAQQEDDQGRVWLS